MILMAIDGASRRNGKPDCLAAGAVFIRTEVNGYTNMTSRVMHEHNSTSQRGEMLALIEALKAGRDMCDNLNSEVYIITDSEFLFNAFNKEWYRKWEYNGWKKADGEPVKNPDLWTQICHVMDSYAIMNLSVNLYHIKGHVITFGVVTARKLLDIDPTGGEALYKDVKRKLEIDWTHRKEQIDYARELFERNHNHMVPEDVFKDMIVCNMTADLVVTTYINEIDKL